MYKILIVDDEEKIRNLLIEALNCPDYSIDQAVDGEDAIQKVSRENYDLVISDVEMPKYDGLEVAKAVKDKSKKACVILITGSVSKEVLTCGSALGVDDYIRKPINDIAAFQAMVRVVLEKRK